MAGTPTCSSRARAMRRASRKRALGRPRWSTTESSESTHSRVSAGSTSGSWCEYPSMIMPPAYGPSGPGCPAPHATVFVAAAPTDPAELDRLADQLAADETALRNPATAEADVPAPARRQQAAYRALAARPEVLPRVLARLPEALRPIAQANV